MKRKIMSILLAGAIVVSMAQVGVLTALADDAISINTRSGEEAAVGETLMGIYQGTGTTTGYQWMASDSANGTYSAISGAVTDKYVLTWNENGKYIKCVMTVDGTEIDSDAVGVPNFQMVMRKGITDLSGEGHRKKTDPKNEFSVNGKDYILVDTFNNDESTFYVVGEDVYVPQVYGGTDTRFNPEVQGTLAYYMNNTLFNSLPASLTNYIDTDYAWITEPSRDVAQYVVKAAIVSPAAWELVKYKDIIGYYDHETTGQSATYWLRTPYQDAGWMLYFQPTGYWGAAADNLTAGKFADGVYSFCARPQFMLDKDYFLESKPEKIGENVYKKLKNVYSLNEILNCGLYTQEEVIRMGYDISVIVPDVSEVSLRVRSGKDGDVGDTLIGSYVFTGGERADNSVCGWYVSDTEDGAYSLIQEENTLEHIVTYEQSDKYIKFGVQPKDIDGNNQFIILSNAVKIPKLILPNLGSPVYESMVDSGFSQDSDEDYIFYVGNDKFILLETFDNDKSTFYVVSHRNYEGDKAFSTVTNKFDPSDTDSLAYYLNHDNRLPTAVQNYINNDHIWITEPMYQTTEPYLTKAGVTVPAVWEMEKYKDILGYKDGVVSWGVWTRSPWSNPAIANEAIHFNYNSSGIIRCYPVLSKTGAAVRPQFMLNRQFFIDNVINYTTMGSKVKEAILNTYTKDELNKYSEEALAEIGYDPKYTLTGKTFTGTFTTNMIASLKVASSSAGKDVTTQVYAAAYDIDGKLLKIVKDETWLMRFTENVEQTKSYVFSGLPAGTASLKIFLWKYGEELMPLCESAVKE